MSRWKSILRFRRFVHCYCWRNFRLSYSNWQPKPLAEAPVNFERPGPAHVTFRRLVGHDLPNDQLEQPTPPKAPLQKPHSSSAGLPDNLIKKLQLVQNTAARLVLNLRKYDRITHSLRFTGFQSNTGLDSKHCWSSSKDFMARHLDTSKKWQPHQKAEDIPWAPMMRVSWMF